MTEAWDLPIAAAAVPEHAELLPDLPLAYLPRLPEAPTYRELLERAVGWGRR